MDGKSQRSRDGESSYYAAKLSAERLVRVYEVAPKRVQQYLQGEIDEVIRHISSESVVLELGCGYGRVMKEVAERAKLVVGIDSAAGSLKYGKEFLSHSASCLLAGMDVLSLGFRDNCFDLVYAIQNGISAFHVEPGNLVEEALRVTRPGGKVLLSTYSSKFWNHRLEWFYRQSEAGLLGEIDLEETGNGVIVTEDGFTGTAFPPERLQAILNGMNLEFELREVDESSLFCEIVKKSRS